MIAEGIEAGTELSCSNALQSLLLAPNTAACCRYRKLHIISWLTEFGQRLEDCYRSVLWARSLIHCDLLTASSNPTQYMQTCVFASSDLPKAWTMCLQDCDDDGESAAGSRLLHLLQITDAVNVVIVVSRWYGGVLLGPARFTHINNAARVLLDKEGYISKDKTLRRKQSKQ